ncbi:protein YibB, partial [Campylobacter coli]|nr:protein YibB [Campylobacter coli]EAJ2644071.1 protein YibB [Campylobacter coli]EAK4300566.1 protein YibB [Campylobacter coli]EHF8023226.1 protein YibB [Campylobacter coli]EIL3899393.1 protein YibB [Campylobacter coli]
ELTIVTAFYNVGRTTRSNEQYLSYFDFWAGLKNKVIIYTTDDMKESILEIRKKHNLEDKTIIITKDLKEFDEQSLEKIKDTFNKYDQTLNRKNPRNIECNNPLYCYLMYLKPFFVVDAIERNLTGENVMWLDFGFNHGDEFFTNRAQFNFLLEKQEIINEEKINFFSVKEEEYKNIANVYFNMEPFIMGGLIFTKSKNWYIFKEHMKNALNAFLSFGMVDDDQIMYLWCTRNHSNNYKIIRSYEWFDALFNFIPIKIKQKLSFKRKNSKYYKIIKEEIKNSKNKNLIYKIQLYIKYIYYKFINKK